MDAKGNRIIDGVSSSLLVGLEFLVICQLVCVDNKWEEDTSCNSASGVFVMNDDDNVLWVVPQQER